MLIAVIVISVASSFFMLLLFYNDLFSLLDIDSLGGIVYTDTLKVVNGIVVMTIVGIQTGYTCCRLLSTP